jgi:hypothetical protein
VDVSGLISLETAVFGAGGLGLEVAQVAHAVPAQTAIQSGTRDIRVKELSNHRQQVIQRYEQCLAQRGGDSFLCRGKGGLQPVRCVAAVEHAIAMAPLVDRLLRRAEPLGQNRRRLAARLDHGAHLRRGRRLLVKMDQHGSTPFRMSLRTDLAMNSADRRGSM